MYRSLYETSTRFRSGSTILKDDRRDRRSKDRLTQPRLGYGAGDVAGTLRRTACSGRSNATRAARLKADDTTTTPRPNGSINSPNPRGASAWQMREGAPMRP